ncbi:SNF2-related protein [Bifidobacterium miconis]
MGFGSRKGRPSYRDIAKFLGLYGDGRGTGDVDDDDDEYGYDDYDDYGEDAGVTYGGSRSLSEAVPDKTLRHLAGNAYWRAQDVIDSGRMHECTSAPIAQGIELAALVASTYESEDDYRVWADIDARAHDVVKAHCTCPAFDRSTSGYCKHVIALIMHYNQAAYEFRNIPGSAADEVERKASAATSRPLALFMRQRDDALAQASKDRQLGLLKEISKIADAGGTAGGNSAGAQAVRTMPPNSVGLRVGVSAAYGDGWDVRLRIVVHGTGVSYVVKNIAGLLQAVRGREFVSYGKKLAFVHTREAFDERSRRVLDLIGRAVRIRASVGGDDPYRSYYRRKSDDAELRLSDDEIVELFDLYAGADDTIDYAPDGRFMLPSLPTRVVAGDPDPGLSVVPVTDRPVNGQRTLSGMPGADEANAEPKITGYAIRHTQCVEAVVAGESSSYMIVRPLPRSVIEADDATFANVSVESRALGRQTAMFAREHGGVSPAVIYRCGDAMAERGELLQLLCGSNDQSTMMLNAADADLFARTVLPDLVAPESPQPNADGLADVGHTAEDRSAGVATQADGRVPEDGPHGDGGTGLVRAGKDQPDSDAAEGKEAGPSAEPALSVDVPDSLRRLMRVPCRIAFYFDRDQHGISCDARAYYGTDMFHVFDGIGRTPADARRDKDTERLAVEAVLHYFPRPAGPVALLPDDDDEAIYKLLTEGLTVFRGLGDVYATPAFDGMTAMPRPTIRFGLSVASDLVRISPIADEIDPADVPALLAAYRRKRRFHRLGNGAFVDLRNVDATAVDDLSADLGIKPSDFERGAIDVPAYEAYYLDHEVDDAGKDDSFRTYLNGLRVIDPATYRVPDALANVLRPYQAEGFRWLNAVCDKGFGGILADEMGLGKSVQLLSFLLARQAESRVAHQPSLIVCPASLVYNWAAEAAKFAPDLRVETVAGGKASRRALLDRIRLVQAHDGADGADAADATTGTAVAGASETTTPATDARVEDATADAALPVMPDLLVTSYDLLRRDIEDYAGIDFFCMALDEAQYIKNAATKASKAVRQVGARHRFALTGTPIENRLSELWSIFDFLMPGMLGRYAHFRERFEMPILSGDGRAQGKLQAFVGPFILRRLKSQVLKDLPDKIENVITVQLEGEQRKLYAALEQQLRAVVLKQKPEDFNTGKIQILAQLTRLRQVCCDPRLIYENTGASDDESRARSGVGGALSEASASAASAAAVPSALPSSPAQGAGPARKPGRPSKKVTSAKLDAITELVDSCRDAGKKMLIFSQFTSYLDLIAERLHAAGVEYDMITGATPKKQRVELVDRFNQDDTPVFLISLKAGNTGLNLTGACVVVHADPWWNAAAQNQATDRAHRIGQTQDVNVYQIVAKDTIEERIINLQKAKTDLASRFVDAAATATGSSVASLTKEDLLALLG